MRREVRAIDGDPAETIESIVELAPCLVLAAGQVAGVVRSDDGRVYIIKGDTRKDKRVKVEMEERGKDKFAEVRIATDTFVPVIRAIDVTKQRINRKHSYYPLIWFFVRPFRNGRGFFRASCICCLHTAYIHNVMKSRSVTGFVMPVVSGPFKHPYTRRKSHVKTVDGWCDRKDRRSSAFAIVKVSTAPHHTMRFINPAGRRPLLTGDVVYQRYNCGGITW